MTILRTHAIYSNGILKLAEDLGLPDGMAVEVEILTPAPAVTPDPKDLLMDDPATLLKLYAEFADEDKNLAQIGLTHYSTLLRQEESQE